MASRSKMDWTALPDDLLEKIGGCLLANDDLDYYASFRAVCSPWRQGTQPPEIYLTKWIMISHTLPEDAGFTFLNLSTGRFLDINLSEVHSRYYIVGVTNGGVFVLAQREAPHQIRLLDPFSRAANTRFKAHIPTDRLSCVAVTRSPVMVFVMDYYSTDICWADEGSPQGESPAGFGEGQFSTGAILSGMTPYAGEFYVAANNGDILRTNIQLKQGARSVTMERAIAGPVFEELSGVYKFYLVESEGELLLVMFGEFAKGQPVVYRVDTKNNSLEPVSDIGSRALFIGYDRSISYNTSLHGKIEPGSIYYTNLSYIRSYDHDVGAWEENPRYVPGLGLSDMIFNTRPYRLDEILAAYCRRSEFSEFLMSGYASDLDEIYRAE